MLDNYAPIKHYFIDKTLEKSVYTGLITALREYDVVIVNYQGMSRYASKKHGISDESQVFMENLLKQSNTLTVLFGSPYALDKFPEQKSLIVAYETTDDAQEITAQIIFGARTAKGRLPVGAGQYNYGCLLYTSPSPRDQRGSRMPSSA